MFSRVIELFQLYSQDFDLLFERDTDPIDIYCAQHSAREQRELLQQMKEVYEEVLSGRKSLTDLVDMGLEYVPSDDPSPEVWLPSLIEYLEQKG